MSFFFVVGMSTVYKHVVVFFPTIAWSHLDIMAGYRTLGFGVGMSTVSAAFINGALESKTSPVRSPTVPTLSVILYLFIQPGGKYLMTLLLVFQGNFVCGCLLSSTKALRHSKATRQIIFFFAGEKAKKIMPLLCCYKNVTSLDV
jgi:hypothetical protein